MDMIAILTSVMLILVMTIVIRWQKRDRAARKGGVLYLSNDRVYQVMPDGSFRRLKCKTPELGRVRRWLVTHLQMKWMKWLVPFEVRTHMFE